MLRTSEANLQAVAGAGYMRLKLVEEGGIKVRNLIHGAGIRPVGLSAPPVKGKEPNQESVSQGAYSL